MPILRVSTNVDRSKIRPELRSSLAQMLSKSLGKPMQYVVVQIIPNEEVYFGASDSPAALCTLSSIGSLSQEKNKKYSKEIMAILKTNLEIQPDRIYIEFKDLNKANVGFQSTTFHELM